MRMKKIAFVASEAVPFVKTGGLADVVGSLPKSFVKEDFDVRVILPKYACMKSEYKDQLEYITNFYIELNGREQYIGVLVTEYEGIKFYFVDNEEYFGGDRLYYGAREDLEKFALFSKAALALLPAIDFRPDVIHCHDWQTGLVPVYLNERFQGNEFYRGIKTVMTIHNLRFQGAWDIETIQRITGLSDYYFTSDKLEQNQSASYLKGGIVFADVITTVSNTYATEIKTPFYGEGLDALLCARADDLRGIVNGIDYDEYNPEKDNLIGYNYNVVNFRKEKLKNKLALQKELGLLSTPKVMMLGVVSRLTDQKGFDLIAKVMDEMCQEDIQLVVLGTGEQQYENMFRHFAWKYSEKVSANIYYSEAMSHKIYASCDAFLMPSLFEPCGLSQLMSLRYGTVPIVRETGGLRDTVQAYNEYDKVGTGFSFINYDANEMLNTINYAKNIYYNKKREWNKIVDQGMSKDFSWGSSAAQYAEMYEWLT